MLSEIKTVCFAHANVAVDGSKNWENSLGNSCLFASTPIFVVSVYSDMAIYSVICLRIFHLGNIILFALSVKINYTINHLNTECNKHEALAQNTQCSIMQVTADR